MSTDESKKSLIAQEEEKILEFWAKNNIFEKTLTKDAPNGNFVFYDGPPFATGLPHYGHVLPGTMKDLIPRYQTMKGKRVLRRWGWDCHGLPIENLVEKELGLKNKQDIEKFGLAKFNQAARDSVLRFEDEWKKVIPRMGRFVDMDNAYKTMDWTYTESVWWSFKTLFDKKFVYRGFKSMHLCPHCQTTLSNFEVGLGYKDITDISVTAKFELLDEPGTYVLAWTTTPWTLPGNVALAVNSGIEYVVVESEGSKFIVAKKLAEKVFAGKEYKIVGEKPAKDLVGKKYKPPFDYYVNDSTLENQANGWQIYPADFVTDEDGTGIAHEAPAFGEEDYQLLKEHDLPFVQHVSVDGEMREEVKDFVGKSVKPKGDHQATDIEIIKYLAHNNLLFGKEKIVHSYPHCWRCDTPLLNYASNSWFVKVTDLKDKLVKENKKVNWVPESIGANRFGKWLEDAKDWAISRSRYWGAPLPIWHCEDCDKNEIIGSVDDLKKKVKPKNNYLVMRHGQSEGNVRSVISAVHDSGDHLTVEGQNQARATSEKLEAEKIDLIIHSGFDRTKETATIVAEELRISPDQLKEDRRLGELDASDFEGRTWREYWDQYATRQDRVLDNSKKGESISQVRKRALEVMFDLERKYEGKNILLVAHAITGVSLELAVQNDLAADKFLYHYNSQDYTLLKNAEVRKIDFVPLPHNQDYELDLHRPFIDEVSFSCDCGGEMKRVSEVFDTWYDSGSMPYAQNHYPFENKELFEEKNSPLFPADFIAEGLDQTRGWFYTLLILNTGLFDQSPYQNVVVNGIILAEDGQKMSKKLKNYPDPMMLVNKYGADALRYYLMASGAVKAEDVAFSEKGVDEVMKKLSLRLLNVLSFYEMYGKVEAKDISELKLENPLDLWILARLSELNQRITESLDKYELDRATRPMLDFVDDLSTWYLRRSRDRFKEEEDDALAAVSTTKFVLTTFSKLLAPVMPFLAERIYLKLKDESDPESVHLCDWPEAGKMDEKVIEQMAQVRKLVSLGLEARSRAGIKIRQPLSKFIVRSQKSEVKDEYLVLIKDELNVKEVLVDENISEEVELDTAITPELKKEGQVRELIRQIQDLRKKKGLQPADATKLLVETDQAGEEFVKFAEAEIKTTTNISEVVFEANKGVAIIIDDFKLVASLS